MLSIITTTRLQLRPLENEDFATYRAIISDPIVAQPAGLSLPMTPDQLRLGFKADRQQPLHYAIFRSNDAALLGLIMGYPHVGDAGLLDEQALDLGYFLAPNVWGAGYMTEALQGVLTALEAKGGPITTLWATCLASNVRSQHVLSHLTFKLIEDHLMVPNALGTGVSHQLLYQFQIK